MKPDSTIPLKHWAEEYRPREKMRKLGPAALSDAELIALLLRVGNLNETAVDLARRLLSHYSNSLALLGKADITEFCKFKGIGPDKASVLMAALEIGRRRKENDIPDKQQITTSSQAFQIFSPLVSDLSHEEFWVALLNRQNHLIHTKNISKGGLTGTVADTRLIFRNALEHKATSIILCHNHPSGNTKPSKTDKELTLRLAEAGKLLEIAVLDHLIISGNQFFSFTDSGLL